MLTPDDAFVLFVLAVAEVLADGVGGVDVDPPDLFSQTLHPIFQFFVDVVGFGLVGLEFGLLSGNG